MEKQSHIGKLYLSTPLSTGWNNLRIEALENFHQSSTVSVFSVSAFLSK